MKKIGITIVCLALMLGVNSCGLAQWAVMADPSTSNQTKGTVVGATNGAQVGAWVGSITGGWDHHNQNTILGAAIGAVAGAAVGSAVGSSIDKKQGTGNEYTADPAYSDDAYYSENDYSPNRSYYHPNENSLYFKGSKTKLTGSAKRQLDQVAAQLRNDRTASVEIYGHTDDSGSYNDRRRVSAQRAYQVANYLRRHGVTLDQIYARGCADQYPVASNSTKDGRKRNNRVEILVTRNTPITTRNEWHY